MEVTGVFYEEDCSDISSWADNDVGDGVSSQVTFENKPTFKLDSGPTTGSAQRGYRVKDVGTFETRTVIEISLYHQALGAFAATDRFVLRIYKSDVELLVVLCTEGFYVNDGSSWNLIDADIVQTGVWQTWIFDCDFSTPSGATVNVYLDDSEIYTDVDCSRTGTFTGGEVHLIQEGWTNAHRITYVDYIKIGTGLSINDTEYAVIKGKPLDEINSILQGVTTDGTSAIMRSVITSYQGSVVRGYIHDKVPAILQGVVTDNIEAAVLGVTPSFRSAILFSTRGIFNERGSISIGKSFDNVFAILDTMIHDRRYSIVKGKTYNSRTGLVLGNIFSNIGSIIQSVLFDYRNVTIRGKSFDNIWALVEGKTADEDDIYAILKGRYYMERGVVITGKYYLDMRALILGVSWSNIKSVIFSAVWLGRYAIEEGKPYAGRSSVVEGHLIRTSLTFRYNINRASFDYYYALTEMASTYKTEANVTFYEENSRPVYIYYGSGHEAYEYYPSTEILIPAYSNVPSDAEWEIKVYANAVDNREERNAVIKELSKVDFDGEIRSAFSKVVDQSYHTFRINLGIAGILNDVYAIMRVKATSDRTSWILGKDYPLYIIGTDFGVYSLLTTTRRIKIAEARFAIIRGLALPYSLLYGILYGVGKAESLLEGVVKGKVFSEIWSIIEGIMSPENDEYGVIRGCTHCAVDVYSEGEAVTGGRGFVIWQGTEDSKSLNRYEEIYEGPWNPRVLIGTANEGFYITAIEDWIINNVDSLRDVLIQGVSTNNVSSILSGE